MQRKIQCYFSSQLANNKKICVSAVKYLSGENMSNQITASVEFYFKGEKFNASIELELDLHMAQGGELPPLYPLLAQSLNMGLYSYEYEMMQAETIAYNNAKGLCVEFCNDGCFDFESFASAWLESSIIHKLSKIAQTHLSIDDLSEQPAIKNALLEAYKQGASD